MNLAVLDKQLPLKAYDPEKLNTIVLTALTPFISGLLSLTDETSAKRLELALPAIKDLCWGMSFKEITKMFEMYADNKLSIKPMSNYFDRILLGKIVEAYKQQKPTQKPVYNYMSQDEKDFIMSEAVDRIAKDYKQHGKITESCFHVYDHLFSQGKLPKGGSYKVKKFSEACLIYAKGEFKDENEYQKIISTFNKQDRNEVKNIAKRLVLEDYYKQL